MNLNPRIMANSLSLYFEVSKPYELKTYHDIVDSIYFKVTLVQLKVDVVHHVMVGERKQENSGPNRDVLWGK